MLGERPVFAPGPLVISDRHSHDPICQGVGLRVGSVPLLDPGAFTLRQHTNYTAHGEPQEAARLVGALPGVRGPDGLLTNPIYPPDALRQLGVFNGAGTPPDTDPSCLADDNCKPGYPHLPE